MNNKNLLRTLLIAAATTMTLASCDKNETEQRYDGKVQFSSGIIASQTRVAIDNKKSIWEANDPVGIYMVNHGTTDISEGAANVKYLAASGGANTTFTPAGTPIYYPLAENATVDFIAYHPYREGVADYVYSLDVSDQSSQTSLDLMLAKADKAGTGYDKTDGEKNEAVNFTFTHQLAKLVLTVKKGDGVNGDVSAVSIKGMNTKASFDLKGTGGVTGAGTPLAIMPRTITPGVAYEAILLPVSAIGDSHTVTFVAGGETYTWNMKDDIASLEAGKMYEYEITVTKYAVGATGAIKDWATGGTGSGVAD